MFDVLFIGEAMPHDKNGQLLEVGDEVLVRAKVEEIWPGATTCNMRVRTVEKMTPDHSAGDAITLNANQVEKVAVQETSASA
jgi:hypothetical protein